MSKLNLADRLELIQESIAAIESYFLPIKTANDFFIGQGAMIFDAIGMRLQVLGENVKVLYKRNPEMFIDVEKEIISIIRFRDLISHHYEKLDTEIIFEICSEYVPRLERKMKILKF